VAANVDPAVGLAFLGAQVDVWDAQKDMVLAFVGAAVTLVVALDPLAPRPGVSGRFSRQPEDRGG
jgi:uncharacterized membrane protein YjdF